MIFDGVADELDTICGQAKFGCSRTADTAQQFLVMAKVLMLGDGFLALRVPADVDVAEEHGKQVRA